MGGISHKHFSSYEHPRPLNTVSNDGLYLIRAYCFLERCPPQNVVAEAEIIALRVTASPSTRPSQQAVEYSLFETRIAFYCLCTHSYII